MREKGLIVDMNNKGYLVELDSGEIGLLPVGDTTKYKFAETFLNRKVEVDIDEIKDDIILLRDRFRLTT